MRYVYRPGWWNGTSAPCPSWARRRRPPPAAPTARATPLISPGSSRLTVSSSCVGHLEHQLVVHLHDEPGCEALAGEPAIHGDHRHLDEIGGGALHRRVDRGALRALAPRRRAALDLGQPQPAAEHGLDVARSRAVSRVRCMYSATPGIAREIAVHVLLRRRALDAELAREPERRHAVDQPEVDHLGVAPLLRADARPAPCRRSRRRSRGGCPRPRRTP